MNLTDIGAEARRLGTQAERTIAEQAALLQEADGRPSLPGVPSVAASAALLGRIATNERAASWDAGQHLVEAEMAAGVPVGSTLAGS